MSTKAPSSPRRQVRGLHVQLPKQSPRSLNGSATSLTSLDATAGSHSPSSPRNSKTFGIHRLFGRNKENHGTHSGKEDSENEDSSLRLKLNVPTTRHKQFTKVLAEIRERAMPSSLGRRRSKTQSECPLVDTRNSGDSDSGSRPRGITSVGISAGGAASDQLPRGRSATALSLNEDDSAEVDSLDGTFSSQEKESTDEVDGQIDSEKLRQRVEHLNHKIKKTKDQIRQLQDERDEYVKEYLEEGSQKSKAVFEKKNQKTNSLVAQLQKKLEKYHNTLMELELNGAAPSGHIAKDVLKGVRDGVKGAVTKPLEIIKHRRFGSAENVSTTTSSPGSKIDGLEEEPSSPGGEDSFVGDSNLSPARYNSDDDSSSVASATPHRGSSLRKQPASQPPTQSPTSYDQDIIELRNTNARLQEIIDNLRRQLDFVAESLQEERCNSEQLRDLLNSITTEWNDVSELRQNEMITVKQELERAEERIELVEYRSAERASEIEEALDSYVTRVLKIEALQQQSQGLDDYLDQSAQAKALLSKFLTMVLAILQIVLIICTTLARIVIPFTRTRFRIVVTSVVILIVAVLWRYQESDNVRLVMDSVTGQFTVMRDRVISLGIPLQNVVKKIYKRYKT
ncbi:Transmembrane and coiled-coil domains protein 2 [Desmophyllum pertusum]|uniref:Transmembrane and coiled-coil domains protein 2 n=1 Tax=Desmophyllum pertusum TaxID=174260 RepID=A0A9W9ZX47_9CNID|nr:Transmembrane and coiled-coil domains protein 2 [Desmophyllum pertusum]